MTVPTRDAWLGVVAAGKVYYELVQALDDLGLDQRALERAGVRLLKVGMLYPHDRVVVARVRVRGWRKCWWSKRSCRSWRPRCAMRLYGTPDAPRIVGKRDEHDAPLLAAESDLDADAIAVALASRLGGRVRLDSVDARVALIEARRAATARTVPTLARTPMFCSGCPHNTSTANPDDTLLGAGIGCHTMVLLAPEGKGTITGITQMGGEGAQFVGMAPSPTASHFVQNVGDGTFHHSGSLAIRFAAASGANITYKLLYNDTVAMTGGQDVVGQLKIPELTRWLALEGVRADRRSRPRTRRATGGVALDPIAAVRHRDELAEAQAELAAIAGRHRPASTTSTARPSSGGCASAARRPSRPSASTSTSASARAAATAATKSNCLSVLPVETEFGRKTQIHQSSCNKDYSCLKGDCPSFLTVDPGGQGRRRSAPPACPRRPPRRSPSRR